MDIQGRGGCTLIFSYPCICIRALGTLREIEILKIYIFFLAGGGGGGGGEGMGAKKIEYLWRLQIFLIPFWGHHKAGHF